MDNANDKREDIDGILREEYERTGPPDSWQALRERIDTALSQRGEPSLCARRRIAFWRRTALALAACLVVVTGLLLCMLSAERRAASLKTAAFANTPALLTQAEIGPLLQAFSQVRSLFADHQPWLMIDSVGNSQIGLTATGDLADREEGLIILRLIVQEDGGRAGDRYADLVAYPQQRITVVVQTAVGSAIELHLVPTLRKDGRVDLDFVARGDNDSRTARVIPVDPNAVRPLAQLQIGRHRFNLGAIAKAVPLSGQG